MIFYFRLFPEKSNDKSFSKIQNIILEHFLAKIGPIRVFNKNRAPSVFSSHKTLHQSKKSEITNEYILRKGPSNARTYEQGLLYMSSPLRCDQKD